jgi:hypothetical protein
MPLPSPPLEPTATASSPAARRGAAGEQARENGDWAQTWSMGGGGLTQGAAGERRRRTGGGAAAGARISAKAGTGQANVLHGQLH